MKRGHTITIFTKIGIFLLLSLFFSLHFALAYDTFTDEGIFVNPQRGTTQIFENNDDEETVFPKITAKFSSSKDVITYDTLEAQRVPSRFNTFANTYRFFSFEPDDENAIEELTIEFAVKRNNDFDLNPANVALFGYTQEKTWERISHSIAYTTSAQYVFRAVSREHFQFVIANANSQPTQQENDRNTSTPANNPFLNQQNNTNTFPNNNDNNDTERIYVDDSQRPNWILVVIIFILLVGAIGGTVSYVIAKHKIGPTKIEKVDTTSLAQSISKSISQKKTNGQIVDEHLDRGYSLKDIMYELKRLGRVR